MNRQNQKAGWTPTKHHAEWLEELVHVLKIGGRWYLPSFGIYFTKTAEKTLKLKTQTLSKAIFANFTDADVSPEEIISRTVKTAEKAGIKVIIE